jgi:hypothetical protein
MESPANTPRKNFNRLDKAGSGKISREKAQEAQDEICSYAFCAFLWLVRSLTV